MGLRVPSRPIDACPSFYPGGAAGDARGDSGTWLSACRSDSTNSGPEPHHPSPSQPRRLPFAPGRLVSGVRCSAVASGVGPRVAFLVSRSFRSSGWWSSKRDRSPRRRTRPGATGFVVTCGDRSPGLLKRRPRCGSHGPDPALPGCLSRSSWSVGALRCPRGPRAPGVSALALRVLRVLFVPDPLPTSTVSRWGVADRCQGEASWLVCQTVADRAQVSVDRVARWASSRRTTWLRFLNLRGLVLRVVRVKVTRT
jgi:hypothetical protein